MGILPNGARTLAILAALFHATAPDVALPAPPPISRKDRSKGPRTRPPISQRQRRKRNRQLRSSGLRVRT